MKTKKSEEEIIIENSERAIELINKIYDDFDEMNVFENVINFLRKGFDNNNLLDY